ncbi:DUF1501 domain-containing protein [bacterium]|nr:DUF1501 domain-containing protein [bacterium]
MKRRNFLLALAGGFASVEILNSSLASRARVLSAQGDLLEKNRNVLLVVFLRGGFDGLSLVCPSAGDDRKSYEAMRPSLALPLAGDDAILKLDDQFGLNAAAKPLHEIFKQKRLAFVHGCGLPVSSRSHFAAQTLMELGVTRSGADNRGWLTRFMQKFPCKAAVIGPLRPTSLQGNENTLAYTRLRGLGLDGSPAAQNQLRSSLRELYASHGSNGQYGLGALNMLDELEDLSFVTSPNSKVELPSGEIAQKFALASQLLQRDQKLQIIALDIGGWDTHRQQGSSGDGYFAKQLSQLSKAMSEFYQSGLASTTAWVTTVVMSEFGRRVKENGNRGTDHGHGNTMMVLGPRVQGGSVYGRWPGLANDALFERADLAVTTDVRSVLFRCLQAISPTVTAQDVFGDIDKQLNPELKLFV